MSQYPYVPLPAAPAGRGRPGLVTAVGVTSIIVASICLIGGLANGFYVFGVQWLGRISANQAQSQMASAAVAQQAAAATGGGVFGVPSPDQLERENAAEQARLAGRRDALVELFTGLHELSDDQRRQLAAVLGRHADRIVPHSVFTARGVTAADVRDWVQRAGSLPADAPTASPPVFFRLTAGELTLYDDRAVFRAGDGTGTIRSAARDGESLDGLRFTLAATDGGTLEAPASAGGDPAAGSPAGPATTPVRIHRSGMADADVEQAIQMIETNLSGNGATALNPSQLATLRRELQTHVPALVSPGTAYQPARFVANPTGGPATLYLTNGSIEIDSSGTVVTQSSNAVHQVTLNPVAGVLMVGELFASAALAVFLLVSGIMLLRHSPRAAGLHWLYAVVKLPVAVLGGVTFAWVTTELSSGFGRMNGTGPAGQGPVTFAWTMALAAATYPVVLLFVLSSRTVRTYFASERR